MLSSAIKDAHEQVDTGWNWEELNADNITPDSRAIKTA
jgi:hypothetical protein